MQPRTFLPRRHFMAGCALAPLVPLPLLAAAAPLRMQRELLGTMVEITVAEGSATGVAQHVEAAFAEMGRLERLMSRFDPASEVSHLNRAAGTGMQEASPELMAVLLQARALAASTQGAFDPVLGRFTAQADPGGATLDAAMRRALLPHARSRALVLDEARRQARLSDPLARLDLGGVAKLPILQAGLHRLQRAGLRGCMVNGGGDVLATARPDGQPWRIGIRDAAYPDRLLAVWPLRAGVVASSGDYERFVERHGQRMHHIIDPATGQSTRGVHGVTMVAADIRQVNGLGTAAMVAGPARALQRLQQWGVQHALVMRADGQVQASASMHAGLQAAPGRPDIRGLAG